MSPTYSLPSPLHYVDTAAAAVYGENKGAEVVVSQTISAPVGVVFDAWVQHIWLAGGTEITPGEGRGYVNHTRVMAKVKVEEQIQSAGLPSTDDSDGVASVLYKVTNAGPMPLADHIALVRFIQRSPKETEIVWTIKVTPKPEAAAGITALTAFLKKSVAGGLAQFAKAFNKSKL